MIRKQSIFHQSLLLSILLTLLVSSVCFSEVTEEQNRSQDSVKQQQRVEDLKKRIVLDQKKLNVMEHMQLSSEEAKIFWPIYDEFQEQLVDLEIMRSKLFSFYVAKYKSMDNQNTSQVMDKVFEISDSRSDVLKRLTLALEDVLPARRVFRYLLIESNQSTFEYAKMLQQIPLLE